MANVSAPFGFRPVKRLDGAAWTGGHTTRVMANTVGALNRGDVVAHSAAGTPVALAAGVTAHTALGVYVGCHYLATSLGYPIWSNYWPGAGAAGNVEIQIVDDPLVVFEVQSTGAAAVTTADIGMNADIVVTASTTGISKWSVAQATLAVTATFPFRIVGLGDPGANVGNGYDHTSANNIVLVAWNDQFHRQMTGL